MIGMKENTCILIIFYRQWLDFNKSFGDDLQGGRDPKLFI